MRVFHSVSKADLAVFFFSESGFGFSPHIGVFQRILPKKTGGPLCESGSTEIGGEE